MGIAPWIFEGRASDDPGLEWIYLALEFNRIETSVKVHHG
jgi:hypothetical protein